MHVFYCFKLQKIEEFLSINLVESGQGLHWTMASVGSDLTLSCITQGSLYNWNIVNSGAAQEVSRGKETTSTTVDDVKKWAVN